MDKNKQQTILPGLYLISTPIGNMQDITYRAINILENSDIILCEDTRRSSKILSHFNIEKKVFSYHKFNEKKMSSKIIEFIKERKVVSLISDAGTPTISDPGSELIQACIENCIKVFSIPGPSAVIASLVSSGISTEQFCFLGFVPRLKKQKKIFYQKIANANETAIFFESPKRILKTLNDLKIFITNRNIALVRELTKKNEEIITGGVLNVLEKLEMKEKILGEMTVIISANSLTKFQDVPDKQILDFAKDIKKEKLGISTISKLIAEKYKVSKRRVYQLLIENKNQL